MQPVEAQKGVHSKSQLYNSLKVYLNNQKRLQPIIGLGSITECVKADSHNREILYLCEVCVRRLSKADMRNHIMGSLHRYKYIKAWHPHLLSEWKEQSDLSKLAWPLMELAKTLEGKEGPGDVQYLEVEEALYRKMETNSENDAVTLIAALRDGQRERWSCSDSTSVQLGHNPIQSQRTVLLTQSQQRQDQKCLRTSAETSRRNTSPEPSTLPENPSSFVDGYTGTKPLIGLCCILECRSEDGRTCCFLCHCCRIRSNNKDIIDHLTTSSHLVNYLMEIHPEQVESMMADVNDNCQPLLSLAEKVEREEGRGEPEVVNPPESLCRLLTGKSYHWCVKMLCAGWTGTNISKQKMPVKGPSVNKRSDEGRPDGCDKRMLAKRKTSKARNTVFNVSLPLNKGSLLLERTSFSTDSLPVSTAYCPPADSDLLSLTTDSECDCDTGSFANNQAETASQLQQNLYSGDLDAGQYMEAEENMTLSPNQEDGHLYNQYFTTGRKYQTGDAESLYSGQHRPQQRATFYKEWQSEDPQIQHEWLPPAVPHLQDWSSHDSSCGHGAARTEQWSNPTSHTGPRGQNEMSSDAAQQYYQQHQHQYMAQGHAQVNTYPHLMDLLTHTDRLEPRRQFPEFTIGHFQPASQSYMTHAAAHPDIQVRHGMLSNTNHNIGPGTIHVERFPHQVGVWGGGGRGNSGDDGYSYGRVCGGGGTSQSNAFIPSGC